MARRVVGLGLLVGCVLCSTGCRRPEQGVTVPAAGPTASTPAPSEPPPAAPLVVDLPELAAPSAEANDVEPPAPPEPAADASGTDEESPPSRLLLTDSADWEWPEERRAIRSAPEDDDRAWVREAAEAARDSATSGSASRRLEEVTIASGTVDGRVRRVRPGTVEVSDGEGNVYELRIDGRSRALRRGRHISINSLAEGMPVRASFDLVGDGESLARDIELRR